VPPVHTREDPSLGRRACGSSSGDCRASPATPQAHMTDRFPEQLWVMPAFSNRQRLQIIYLTPKCRNPFAPLGPERTHAEMIDWLWRHGIVDYEAILRRLGQPDDGDARNDEIRRHAANQGDDNDSGTSATRCSSSVDRWMLRIACSGSEVIGIGLCGTTAARERPLRPTPSEDTLYAVAPHSFKTLNGFANSQRGMVVAKAATTVHGLCDRRCHELRQQPW
jgi:hypothetical protein